MRLGLLVATALGILALAPEAEYEARAAKLGNKNPKGWLELANFCEEHLLWDKRSEALRRTVAIEPGNAEAHARLDEMRSGKDWLPADEAEAKEAEEMQAKGLAFYGSAWLPQKEAAALKEADRKLVGWALEVRLDTPHLRIYSARPLDFTRRLAGLLENEVGAYERLYGRIWKSGTAPKAMQVFVFADRPTFEKIATATGHPISQGASGFYEGGCRILFVGVTADKELGSPAELRCTAVHEMLHALDHQMTHVNVVGAPCWLMEGRANHFGFGILGRQVLPGALNEPDGTGLLHDGCTSPIPISEVMDQANFKGANQPAYYALATAWVHFLFHGEDGRHASAFRTYLSGCPGKASKADFEKAVGRISDLEPPFREYVQKTLRPSIRKTR